jgi:hypothetical protein
MKYFLSALLLAALAADAATTNAPSRVPPIGIKITTADRAELSSGAAELGKEIDALRRELISTPRLLELLPDVQVFHKAVGWALRYDEFYRPNEVGIARGLLKQGLQRAQQLRNGEAPWLTATGLVVRGYVSKIDGSVQPYGLIVPAEFKAADKPRRLDVWLHGRDNNLTELKFIADRQKSYGEFAPAGAFVLHPYGRYCNAFKFAGEVDVFEALEHVKKFYPIDSARLAMRGFSMGGAGAWHLAAHHPDVWAVAAPGAGFSETADYTGALKKNPPPSAWEQKLWQLYDATDYAANFFNVPVVAYNGTDDKQRQAADMMENAMHAEGLKLTRVWGTNIGHKYTPEAKREVSAFVDEAIARGKEPFPTQVHFTTRTLRYNRGPLVTVEALAKHWQRADVVCDITTNSATLRTTNVTAFRFIPPRPGIMSITVDGQSGIKPSGYTVEGVALANFFLQKQPDGKWVNGAVRSNVRKRPGLQGPIDDVLMDSFLVVRPTGKSASEKFAAWAGKQLASATNEWRAQFRGEARVKDDSQVTDADIAGNNLILFGDPQSNRLLARIMEKLPLKWTAKEIQFAGKNFAASDHGVALIFPNPLNPKRYVVLNSGFTFAAAGAGSNAQQTPKLPDYAVFDLTSDTVALAGFFDEEWKP